MSTYYCVTFDTADRSMAEVDTELAESVDRDTAYGDDGPYTYEYRGNIVWRCGRFEPLDIHAVKVPRALTIGINDTSDSGWGTLYERIDSTFVEIDEYYGHEGQSGRGVVDYFAANHGIVGDRGV